MAYFGKTNPKYFRYFKRLENQRYSRRLATWLIIDAQTMSVTQLQLDAHPAPLELDHPVHPCRPAPTQIHVNDAEQDLGKKAYPRNGAAKRSRCYCGFKIPSCTLFSLLGLQRGSVSRLASSRLIIGPV